MFAQDALRPWLDLAKGDGFKSARAFKPERKTSDPENRSRTRSLRGGTSQTKFDSRGWHSDNARICGRAESGLRA